ncbi:hypothetical protein OF83DRAFT_1142274 [Amylostereum chailletii]|nr:hypothetical protein OF83DRAFT_1142274 [Amylostereum chailletii]
MTRGPAGRHNRRRPVRLTSRPLKTRLARHPRNTRDPRCFLKKFTFRPSRGRRAMRTTKTKTVGHWTANPISIKPSALKMTTTFKRSGTT